MIAKTIGTHSGIFHADEVTGVMLLTRFTKEFYGAKVVRTRDQSILQGLDLILDVGAEYDPGRHRYDHHQKGFYERFSDSFHTKLSASGLIYKHFGREIVQNAFNSLFTDPKYIDPKYRVEVQPEEWEGLYVRLYTDFFEYLDGVDNGVSCYPPDVKPKYKTQYTDLVARVARLNYTEYALKQPSEEEKFERAVQLVYDDFMSEIVYIYTDLFVGLPIVKRAIERRFEVHPSGKIIFLESSCAWKNAVFRLETQLGIEGEVLFVVYKEKHDGTHRVQAVPPTLGSFEQRKPINPSFHGLRDAELAKLSGVPSAVFCHASGFIGGAQTYEDAIKLAELSL